MEKEKRVNAPTIIDADGHVQEKYIRWEDYLDEPYRAQAPRVVQDNHGVDFLMVVRTCWLAKSSHPKPSTESCAKTLSASIVSESLASACSSGMEN